ncbi:hypothetical protein ThesuDRAFT_01786 [Thermaerobacter subterraneus DSM 13965]|uniref:Uncharacterized protein n=1 Tax=Thermaerobacter subterraneus DSM 13965 TaxID=867903 RepID=K6PMG7_9FIRM|nr:hypothetical protein ThesuDRAFT_01786 [Thermaerobacter subterraneus DSM 13965]
MSRPDSNSPRASRTRTGRPFGSFTPEWPVGWVHPWQRYVELFRRRLPPAPEEAVPGLAAAAGPYRPLCRTRACYYNREWVCQFDRVEPAPVGVMEAAVCPHALFLQEGGPGPKEQLK